MYNSVFIKLFTLHCTDVYKLFLQTVHSHIRTEKSVQFTVFQSF